MIYTITKNDDGIYTLQIPNGSIHNSFFVSEVELTKFRDDISRALGTANGAVKVERPADLPSVGQMVIAWDATAPYATARILVQSEFGTVDDFRRKFSHWRRFTP